MKIPTNLKHSPVICIENYRKIDGKYTSNTAAERFSEERAKRSDSEGLSLGLAQWSISNEMDISAKIWRHTGNRWSRLSEEMPMHRVLDLAIMICKTYASFKKSPDSIPDILNPNIMTDRTFKLENFEKSLDICTDNPTIKNDIQIFEKIFREEKDTLGERFRILATELKKMECDETKCGTHFAIYATLSTP